MNFSQQELAELFSKGVFDVVIPYLADNVVWHCIGETILSGRKEVINNCKQTADYFKTVQTDFKIGDVVVANNKFVIIGTAEFFRNGKQINFISACDVYEFNIENQIDRITSYCIPDKD